jgi:tetratricopeptide (TPR) repeat protein
LPDAAIRLTTAIDEEVQQALAKIQSSVNTGDYERLVALANWDSLAWTTSALLGCRVAESLIKLRRYDEALTTLEKVQSLFPKAIRPLQLKGLALARKGAWRAAQVILGDLEAAGEQDPETLGIYARTWMDRYQESQIINHLRKSRDLYARAFKLAPSDSYTGINAAAKSVFLEDVEAAEEYAAAVEKLVGTEKVEGKYWETATVAEVQLMRKNYLKAAELYLAAVTMEPESIGSHETTWLQAKRLMAVMKPSEEEQNLIAKVFAHLPASEADALIDNPG